MWENCGHPHPLLGSQRQPPTLHFHPPRKETPPTPPHTPSGPRLVERGAGPPGGGYTPNPPTPSIDPLPLTLRLAHGCMLPCLPGRGHTSLPFPLSALFWAPCRQRKLEVSDRPQLRTQRASLPPPRPPTHPCIDSTSIHPVPRILALDSTVKTKEPPANCTDTQIRDMICEMLTVTGGGARGTNRAPPTQCW